MAEQRVSNERKKELEQLDPFQENLLKAISYAKEYKKQLILIVSALVLVAVVFTGIIYSFRKAENTAAELMDQVVIKYAGLDNPVKGYDKTHKDFENIFTNYDNTIAGRLARIKFAKICYDAGKFDQSYKYYKQAFGVFKDEALMKNFLLAALGHVCIARKDFKEAEKYFLKIENGKTELLKDEAEFALAMLDEAAKDTAGSKKMYEKIVSEYNNSIYKPIAKSKID